MPQDLLSYDVFGESDARRTALVCHGILGSRQNWRTVARKLVAAAPDLRVVTVDHRNHGDAPALPGPHTVAACAEDLRRLGEHLGPPEILVGHSFGGKVVLAAAEQRPPGLEQVWVLDSVPGPLTEAEARSGEVAQVIAALREVEVPLAQRQDIVPILMERGFSRSLARWMTTNLTRSSEGWRWRFDLDGVVEMISDYYPLDLWHVLEAPDPMLEVHMVRAGRSDRWTPDVLERLSSLPPGSPTVDHLLPERGHWLHAEDPDELVALIVDHLV
jgi:pimeloyl-ACP methyl ester carboxylesterase